MYRHCICLRYLLHQLFNRYILGFHRLEGRSVMSSVQPNSSLAASGLGTVMPDSSMSDTYHSVARSLPYDAGQRSRLQRDGLVSRREKSMAHLQEESQPLRRSSSSSSIEPVGMGKKWNGIDSEEGCKVSTEKILSTKAFHGLAYILPSSEDEDVCPTCLDEYTQDNPKIVTRCSHHFHLGCIYEWMERSESCPICGKEMEFCESP